MPDDLDDDDRDDEDIDNAALANDTVSVPDDSTLTDHRAIVLDNAIAPTTFTNDTAFPVTIFLLLPLILFLEIQIYFFMIKMFHNVKLLCAVVKTEWQNIVKKKYLTLILC